MPVGAQVAAIYRKEITTLLDARLAIESWKI
jgi:hypothetical protein